MVQVHKGKKANTRRGNVKAQSGDQTRVETSSLEVDTLEMDEAIAMLRTTRATFYRWLRSGQIKGMKAGRKWRFNRSDILRFMSGDEPKIALRVDVTPLLRELASQLSPVVNVDEIVNATIGDVAKLMLMLGLEQKASEIHVGPHSASLSEAPRCLFRYRVNGKLQVVASADLRLLAPLVEHWKLQSGCNRSEKNIAFEGHYQTKINDQDVICRLTFLPSLRGESFSLHMFQQVEQSSYANLERFIPNARVRERVVAAISESWGLTLIAGLTGSGKTSTLYACMARMANQEKEIVAIEDDASAPIPWITQLSTGGTRGLGVNEALRMAVRFRPDALVVDDLRDSETIRLSLEAAKNGIQVLSSVHAADAIGALQQQVALSGDAFLVSESLRLVLAQRILRKVCPHCSHTYSPPDFHLALAHDIAKEYGYVLDIKDYIRAKGCTRCSGSGYLGRAVVQEILTITPRMALGIQIKDSRQNLLNASIEEGMVPMVQEAFELVKAGKTTLEEVISSFMPLTALVTKHAD
jgi:excisionase family DNA binding protein